MKILRNDNYVSDGFPNYIEINNIDTKYKIGILAAMESEIKTIINVMKCYNEYKIDNIDFYTGNIPVLDKQNNTIYIPIVVGISGPGKVNAAICTQYLIDIFHSELILNVGVAGCINKNLNILDVVVIENVVQSDIDTTAVGDEYGLVSKINKIIFSTDKNIKNILFEKISELPDEKDVPSKILVQEQSMKKIYYNTYKLLGNTSQTNFNSICYNPSFEKMNYKKPEKTKISFVATNDSFIATKEQRNNILSHFPEAEICDMELGAIAQVCYIKNIPFASIKIISDNADETAKINYNEVLKIASDMLYIILKYSLNEIYEN